MGITNDMPEKDWRVIARQKQEERERADSLWNGY
jgi:hypothetical protein